MERKRKTPAELGADFQELRIRSWCSFVIQYLLFGLSLYSFHQKGSFASYPLADFLPSQLRMSSALKLRFFVLKCKKVSWWWMENFLPMMVWSKKDFPSTLAIFDSAVTRAPINQYNIHFFPNAQAAGRSCEEALQDQPAETYEARAKASRKHPYLPTRGRGRKDPYEGTWMYYVELSVKASQRCLGKNSASQIRHVKQGHSVQPLDLDQKLYSRLDQIHEPKLWNSHLTGSGSNQSWTVQVHG